MSSDVRMPKASMIQQTLGLQRNATQPKRDQGPLERILSIRQYGTGATAAHVAAKLGRVKAQRHCAEG